jgi:hypothetical protein
VFADSGHFPQLDAPDRFAELLADFIATTEPATHDVETVRARLERGAAGRRSRRARAKSQASRSARG